MEIDGQRIDLPPDRRLHPVLVGQERLVAVDVIPHVLIVSVEDMRPVDMHHDARLAVTLGVAIAGNVVAAIEDVDLETRLRQFARDHCAGQSRADSGDAAGGTRHRRAASAVQSRLSKGMGAKSCWAASFSRYCAR